MLWPCDLITWSRLLSSNDILLSPYLLTILYLPTIHILPLQNIALTKSAPVCITSRHLLAISISPTSRCWVLTFAHPKLYINRITLWNLAVEKGIYNRTSLGCCLSRERDSFSQAPYLRNLYDEAKMYGMLDAAKHGFLVSVGLLYKRSWFHWYRSRAFIIKGN